MATFYVNDDGNDTDGSTWANALTALGDTSSNPVDGALKYRHDNGTMDDGDLFLIDSTHVENQVTYLEFYDTHPQSYLFNDRGIRVISVNAADDTYLKMTGYIGPDGPGALTFQSTQSNTAANPKPRYFFHGIRFLSNSSTDMEWIHAGRWRYKDCDFGLPSSSVRYMDLRQQVIDIEWDQCEFTWGGRTVPKLIQTANLASMKLLFRDCTFNGITGTGYLITLLSSQVTRNDVSIRFEDMDLTGVDDFIERSTGTYDLRLEIDRCKLPAAPGSIDWFSTGAFDEVAADVICYRCSNADVTAPARGIYYRENKFGVLDELVNSYVTNNAANDGEANYCLRYFPSADCWPETPLDNEPFPISVWYPGGDLTLRIPITTNWSDLTDEDVWAEIHCPGETTDTGSSTIGRFISTKPGHGDAAIKDTSPYLKSTIYGWTNGRSSEYQLQIDINCTEPGPLKIVVYVGRGDGTNDLYVSPEVYLD